MHEVFAECGENCYIELPFNAKRGGPNVMIATANHPIDVELRSRGLQYNKDVFIGENAWSGAGVFNCFKYLYDC